MHQLANNIPGGPKLLFKDDATKRISELNSTENALAQQTFKQQK